MRTARHTKRNNPSRDLPALLTDEQAFHLRSCRADYEMARAAYSRKKYEHGGPYSKADLTKIAARAGCGPMRPVELGLLSVYSFVANPPDSVSVFVFGNTGMAGEIPGFPFGRIMIGAPLPVPGRENPSATHRHATLYGVNGVKYVGTYYDWPDPSTNHARLVRAPTQPPRWPKSMPRY